MTASSAYRRAGGAAGGSLVPNLARELPEPSADGRTYRFRLRPDLRFSNGAPVRPEDVRASIERLIAVNGGGRGVLADYLPIRGAARCQATRCDLSGGIEVDETRLGHHPSEPARRRVPAQARQRVRGARPGARRSASRRGRSRAPARTGSSGGIRTRAGCWSATRTSGSGRPTVPTASPTASSCSNRGTESPRADGGAADVTSRRSRAPAALHSSGRTTGRGCTPTRTRTRATRSSTSALRPSTTCACGGH